MRVAFLTPEHPSEYPDGGGLASYVHRIARAMLDAGHEPEVFFPSRLASETCTYDGVQIHRVNAKQNHPVLRLLSGGSRRIIRNGAWNGVVQWLLQAKALAVALEARHDVAPFQLVQSADYLATGLFVRHLPDRQHVVRCSSAADLYRHADQLGDLREICREYLERRAIRRANASYAPSRYIACHFRRIHNIDVRVVRPPAYWEVTSLPEPSIPLPARFFLHFGVLTERKGTAVLAAALPIAWEITPDLTMVWSGHCPDERQLKYWRSLWGSKASQVQITGPLSRPQLYAVLKRADAAVLPSQVDNLPNTVIESLVLGIPVLGSRGASIDELIDEGKTGHLVPLGDAKGLGEALAMMWLKMSPVSKGFKWN